MFRRSFLFGSILAAAGKRRRRKPAPARPADQPNEIERAQLLAAIPDDQIRLALAIRFLGLWSNTELEAELARRIVRRKQ
ncbi:MAG: hypothetical protein JNK38_01260 [Acidobacteria bacterium]|nr:hypothetical protein [Acidobacteriota bacterium]